MNSVRLSAHGCGLRGGHDFKTGIRFHGSFVVSSLLVLALRGRDERVRFLKSWNCQFLLTTMYVKTRNGYRWCNTSNHGIILTLDGRTTTEWRTKALSAILWSLLERRAPPSIDTLLCSFLSQNLLFLLLLLLLLPVAIAVHIHYTLFPGFHSSKPPREWVAYTARFQ